MSGLSKTRLRLPIHSSLTAFPLRMSIKTFFVSDYFFPPSKLTTNVGLKYMLHGLRRSVTLPNPTAIVKDHDSY
jgi:hypothetical protein